MAGEVGCLWPWPCSWPLYAEHKPLSEAFLGNNDKLWRPVKWFSKSCTGIHKSLQHHWSGRGQAVLLPQEMKFKRKG